MRQNGKLQLRPARMADAVELWHWRNDPETRAHSFQTRRISLAVHRTWLKQTLNDTKRKIFVAAQGSHNLGTIRFDFLPVSLIQVSIQVNPDLRGHGHGLRILKKASDLMRRKYPRHFQKAMIKNSNRPSEKIFQSAGFIKIHEADAGYSVWIRS